MQTIRLMDFVCNYIDITLINLNIEVLDARSTRWVHNVHPSFYVLPCLCISLKTHYFYYDSFLLIVYEELPIIFHYLDNNHLLIQCMTSKFLLVDTNVEQFHTHTLPSTNFRNSKLVVLSYH